MQTILLVIHLLITTAMIGVILVQRSEGGMGLGSGTMGGLMTTRGSANLLTHVTAILAIGFLATSLGLAILASQQSRPSSILDGAPQSETSHPQPQSGPPLKGATK